MSGASLARNRHLGVLTSLSPAPPLPPSSLCLQTARGCGRPPRLAGRKPAAHRSKQQMRRPRTGAISNCAGRAPKQAAAAHGHEQRRRRPSLGESRDDVDHSLFSGRCLGCVTAPRPCRRTRSSGGGESGEAAGGRSWGGRRRCRGFAAARHSFLVRDDRDDEAELTDILSRRGEGVSHGDDRRAR